MNSGYVAMGLSWYALMKDCVIAPPAWNLSIVSAEVCASSQPENKMASPCA
eukprot:CAMPEP_0178526998 /NCGR_PEP_ID=MMETSP0696-20121128/31027_1 /TAXON_ID=265572 /ORGANISM="Extubocellulus spinifer, Strain CCMP396" /LENGTH=50 /DNA_ID=CAMNT_0020158541 /DNA_START=186 /DNA_END=338 /DNA_ORIENTATION=+